jgi:DnaJ domain/Domain of unknown function (DUF4388)
MRLASRLRNTTLGDLLAVLHRSGASGVLELIEPHARHAIHLRRGQVQAVETNMGAARLGDVAARKRGISRPLVERARMFAHSRGIRIGQALVATQAIRATELDDLLAIQQRERLDHLYALPDAEVRFRVARPLPSGTSEQTPLSARDAFFGRPRRQERLGRVHSHHRGPGRLDEIALATLGLTAAATREQIRGAFRQLVLRLHPDRAGDIGDQERSERSQQLLAVLDAYQRLSHSGSILSVAT